MPTAARLDADAAKLRRDLVRGRQLEPREPEERVPAREPSRRRSPRGLARVEEATAPSGMLDQEGVDGHRLVAPLVDHVTANAPLARLGADVTGDQADDAHERGLAAREGDHASS